MAAGQVEPTDEDWRMLGVEPRSVAVDDDPEFAYGVWRTLSWLLGVREDFPIYTSWHRAADLPPDRPHLYAPLRGGEPDAAWFAAEQAARTRRARTRCATGGTSARRWTRRPRRRRDTETDPRP